MEQKMKLGILGTGMIEGMEHSYARLERSLLAEPV